MAWTEITRRNYRRDGLRYASHDGPRRYDRIVEGPIHTAVAKARRQLPQSRAKFPDASS